MIAQNALRRATAQLNDLNIETAARDARLLLAACMGISPSRLTLELSQTLTPTVLAQYDELIAQRCTHKPVSRILGYREFWGRHFSITSDVLDPRGDTETLISTVLPQPAARVLDLGTGSGILAVTLAAEWPETTVVASDISPKALQVAQNNAETLGVAGRVQFLQSNWFDDITGTYDLIVSNPPYIADAEMAELMPDVVNFDPKIALTPGGDGLDPYRIIAEMSPQFLNAGGSVAVEIGWRQGASVVEFFHKAGFSHVEIQRDLDCKDRVVLAKS